MSVIFPPAILGQEMAAPILRAPCIFWFFLLENPHAHKIPPFRGGGVGVSWKGGWKCQFYFMVAGIFLIIIQATSDQFWCAIFKEVASFPVW